MKLVIALAITLVGCSEVPVYPDWNSFATEPSSHSRFDRHRAVPVPDALPGSYHPTKYESPLTITF